MAVMAAACGHAGVVVALSGVGGSGSVGQRDAGIAGVELGLVEIGESAPLAEACVAPAAEAEEPRVVVREVDRAAVDRGAAAMRAWGEAMRVESIERVRVDGALEELRGGATVIREGAQSVAGLMESVREVGARAARAGEVMRGRRTAVSAAREAGGTSAGGVGSAVVSGARVGSGGGRVGGGGRERAGGVECGPVAAMGNRAPEYPSEAKRAGFEGRVEVGVRVSAKGIVTSAWVVSGSGASALDASVLEAAQAWRFAPALDEGGAAVECEVVVPVEFRLRKR
jgi:protein TonB